MTRALHFLLAFSVVTAAPRLAAAKGPTAGALVAVGPFLSSSAEEHRWLSLGLAEMLVSRLSRSDAVHVLSIRQWGAVLRERDLAVAPLDSDEDQRTVGRSLGARHVITGSYQARWPDLTVQVRLLDVASGKSAPVTTVTVRLQDAPMLDDLLIKALAPVLGMPIPPSPPLRNIYAWRESTLCRELLTWQSLSPRAPPLLPRAAAVDAEAHCQEALKLVPRDADALEGLGIARALQGDVPAATSALRSAITSRGSPDMAHVALFWVLYRTGKREAALEPLKEALARRPGFLHARGALGQAYNDLDRHEEAAQQFEAYLAAAPGQPWAMAQLGHARARQGRAAEGVMLSQRALALAPEDPLLRAELASRYIDAQDLENAEQTLRAAVDKDPNQALAYLRMGYVHLLKDERDLARAMLQKAINEADLEAEWRIRGFAHFDLAKLDARNKDPDAAYAQVRQALADGFVDVERLETDVDFAPWRKDPQFGVLLGEARKARERWAMLAQVRTEP